jgi:hypothetical protein
MPQGGAKKIQRHLLFADFPLQFRNPPLRRRVRLGGRLGRCRVSHRQRRFRPLGRPLRRNPASPSTANARRQRYSSPRSIPNSSANP